MKTMSTTLLLLGCTLLLGACGYRVEKEPDTPKAEIQFDPTKAGFSDVQATALRKCKDCHGWAGASAALADVASRANEIERRITLPASDLDVMPPAWASKTLSEEEKTILLAWIRNGTPKDRLP